MHTNDDELTKSIKTKHIKAVIFCDVRSRCWYKNVHLRVLVFVLPASYFHDYYYTTYIRISISKHCKLRILRIVVT